jgi:ABC-type Mn2+/Zn2+ transport system ATPase subunit
MIVPPRAIDAVCLCVGYRNDIVVHDLDLDLGPGDLLVLMGTNGSGKSTLLRTMAGLLAPLSGTVTVFGEAPGRQPRRVAYLAQRPQSALGLPIRAADVVAMGRFARLGLVRHMARADRAVCAAAMARLGVDEFADAPIGELSGGQQQRVYLAQALVREADLLLIDEPTAGLDQTGRQLFADVIDAERQRGVTVVMATHDLGDAERATHAALLARRVIAMGTPDEVLTDAHLRECFGFTDRH